MNKTECGLLIKQISDHISKSANNALRADNLTLSQLRCLEYIHGSMKDKIPLKEIEAHFHISQPTLAGIVARLTQKGLVITEASDKNPRAKTVSVTPEGKALFLKSDERREKMEDSLLAALSGEERTAFYEMLKKVYSGLKKI